MFTTIFRAIIIYLALVPTVNAADLDLSPVPLYLGGVVEPNIMFTLDDSGSMQWEIMPDENRHFTLHTFPRPTGLYGGTDYTNQVPNYDADNVHNFFGRSANNNTVFYNPDVTYVPWSNSNGTSMGDATPTAVLYNPNLPAVGNLNLTVQQTQNACWFTHTTDLNTAFGDPCFGNHTYWPITYYNYNGGTVTASTSYTRVQITTATSSATNFTSPSGVVRTRDEEIQNFANWFQYYRSRILTARAGIGRAFARQGTNLRVGFSAINQGAVTVDGVASTNALIQGVRSFSGTDRSNFFDNLYGRVINNSGTPLRSSVNAVGTYYERADNQGPWSETPGTTNAAAHLSCRQSYNILMTDGYWNGADPGVGNSDNTNGTTITGPDNPDFQYLADNPYKDGWSNTLADVGMDFWKRDLRSTLDNNVPTNAADDAFWQHMVNFTVGLGVNGSLDPTTALPGLTDGTTPWPDPTATSLATIDDLWHTAINSRGGFFSASDPDTFADSLSDILSSISDRTSAASAVAVNSGTITGTTKLYQARFNSGDWTGQLLAFPINLDGSLATVAWDAADLIPAATARKIITFDGTDGQPFRWTDIDAGQQTSLGSEAILNYLRGDQSGEANNGGTYRNRNSLLGDIINSSPTYVGAPTLRYPDNWGSGADENSVLYSAFKSTHSSRQDLIYVGSNDGMLHAFNADTGVEQFAYVPASLYNDLSDLADINYNHQFFLDGSATVVDAFYDEDADGTGEWHSVLVSGLRGGAQGIFALDVTDPTDFNTEATGAAKVLWEFTDADDDDLGYVYGPPSIVRLTTGKWAAVFSGGYNNTFDNGTTNDSTSGNAVLYIVDIADGSLIKKFDTKIGSADDPTGNNRPNGLSQPSVIDFNGDYIADAIYAGDLFGNVWKIDISGNSAGSWKFAYKTGSNPDPIYTACASATCTASNHQAITTQVKVKNHPTLEGYLVVFGTGKYIEVGDNISSGQTTQSMYGIWDRAESTLTTFDRDDLLEQEIIFEVSQFSELLRVITDNSITWHNGTSGHLGWYLDLYNTQSGNTNNFGERQISNTIIRNGRLIFSTLIPLDDPCAFGGTGVLMELDVNSGGRLPFSPFDLNGDGVFSSDDYVQIGTDADGNAIYAPVSGKYSKDGIISQPTVVNVAGGGNVEIIYNNTGDGNVDKTVGNSGTSDVGRQSWRQLEFNF
ncbi:pilus assembly protein PilY [Methylophaga sp. 42_25_T18]|nr:pilus assembly protein PilY [Methylophaga sp. 42_25_T18]OUR85530.1 pilus assembly protein PilY [Methylophaga sp. 42_8_T64]